MKDEKPKIELAVDNIKKPEKCLSVVQVLLQKMLCNHRIAICAYTSFFSLLERRVVPNPSKAITAKDQRRLDNWAINPISGGPNKKPRKLMLETAANANSGDIVFDLPAIPYTIGTTQDTPTPTNKQPVTAVCK